MKDRIKNKLDDDELCVKSLEKSEEKGLTFNELWSKKIYSNVGNVLLYNIILINKIY